MFKHPGLGRVLTVATYPGTGAAALVTYPENPIIANNGYSNWEAVNDCAQVTITIVYNVAPGAVTTVEMSPDPSFDNFETVDTIPLSTEKMNTWVSTVPLMGLIRVNNTSGQQINSVYVNGQVSTTY